MVLAVLGIKYFVKRNQYGVLLVINTLLLICYKLSSAMCNGVLQSVRKTINFSKVLV